jgi:large subunit ribosomal protein L22
MEAVAKLNNCPTSPRKMRLVVDTIRGVEVYKALNTLKFMKKEASIRVEKLLLNAINNWEQKHELDPASSDLYVKEAFVNPGRTLKRFRPAPQGRATRIRKRSNHVTLVVASKTLQAEEQVTVTEENDN